MVDCPLQCCSLYSIFCLLASLYVSHNLLTFIRSYSTFVFVIFYKSLSCTSYVFLLASTLASLLSKQPIASPIISHGSLIPPRCPSLPFPISILNLPNSLLLCLKRMAADPSEAFASMNQTTHHHILEDCNMNEGTGSYSRGKLTSIM